MKNPDENQYFCAWALFFEDIWTLLQTSVLLGISGDLLVTWWLPGANSSSEKPTRGHERVQPCKQNPHPHDSTSMLGSQAEASRSCPKFHCENFQMVAMNATINCLLMIPLTNGSVLNEFTRYASRSHLLVICWHGWLVRPQPQVRFLGLPQMLCPEQRIKKRRRELKKETGNVVGRKRETLRFPRLA